MPSRPRSAVVVLAALLWSGTAPADEEPAAARRATPQDPKNLCEVADSNLERAVAAVAREAGTARPTLPRRAWDRSTPPQWLDRVDRRLVLTKAERAGLAREGFVVPDRLGYTSYAEAFHDVYQSQLPIYISVDAILHAVYAASDRLIADLEETRLQPLVRRVVRRMHETLPKAASAWPREVAGDVDLYLTVARRLLEDAAVAPRLGHDGTESLVAALVAAARGGTELKTLDLFGRPRVIDFSQYGPRGHYSTRAALAPYFRGVMWLSRLELNLVSRSCRSSAPGPERDPRETPREATVALALADLAQRAGVTADLGALDRAFALLAGRREDVSVAQLVELRARARLRDLRRPEVAARLRAAIGRRYQRTARFHFMPDGSTELPAITTLLGPRVVPDAAVTRPLVNFEVPGRGWAGIADVAYALGHDHARRYLEAEIRRYPALGPGLEQARALLTKAPTGPDTGLYGAWLAAIRALAERPRGQVPAFQQTTAFADLRLNSTAAAWAQIKHNYVLLAGQPYDEGGCEIPDGYVDPVPAVYDHLITYADRGAQALGALDPKDTTRARAYFARLKRVLGVLRVIARDELEGRPLTVEQRRFLSMVVEMSPAGTGGPATFTGWYFDLFRARGEAEALARADLVADWFTSTSTGRVVYAGVSGLKLGLFVVDTGGPPRVVVGPVAEAYEHVGPLARRLDDAAARTLPAAQRARPWARSYSIGAPAAPALQLTYAPESGDPAVVTVKAPRPLGSVTVELLDHHRAPCAAQTRPAAAGSTAFRFAPPRGGWEAVEGVRVRVGEFSAWGKVDQGGGGRYLELAPESKP
jgi:hypothetical protein